MTDLLDDHWEDFPHRTGFANFVWTPETMAEWEAIWSLLWNLNVKWEWHNGDRYARRRGDHFDIFAVHEDAYRLDMAIPLPGIEVINNIATWLCLMRADDSRAVHTLNLLEGWIKRYVG